MGAESPPFFFAHWRGEALLGVGGGDGRSGWALLVLPS